MKVHSDILSETSVRAALRHAQVIDKVTYDIQFVVFDTKGSRSHCRGFDIQLGTYDKTSGPTKSRRYKNSGQYGADSIWAATYDEWGWFLAALFSIDPDATAGPYKGLADFNRQTSDKYTPVPAT